jgi:hypothetical protein
MGIIFDPIKNKVHYKEILGNQERNHIDIILCQKRVNLKVLKFDCRIFSLDSLKILTSKTIALVRIVQDNRSIPMIRIVLITLKSMLQMEAHNRTKISLEMPVLNKIQILIISQIGEYKIYHLLTRIIDIAHSL